METGFDDMIAAASAAMPPAMADGKKYNTDEVLTILNRTPLFMTELDETDGTGGENIELEALKALAYEGTRLEIGQNFREQGNEQARAKHWTDARICYDKAIAAFQAPPTKEQIEEEAADELSDVEAANQRKVAEELCYVNRALCNLELKNYRACINDCAACLRLNPSNVKAFYRSASACFHLDKLDAAYDAAVRGLVLDANNKPLESLITRIEARKNHLQAVEEQRQKRLEKERTEAAALKTALAARGIKQRRSTSKDGQSQAPNLEDAAISLEKPTDPTSTLSLPLMLLYPLSAQSDFIKKVDETSNLGDHLSYILPPPWDGKEAGGDGEYADEALVECYCETAVGGLSKVGKKVSVGKILGGGKIEVVDGLVVVNVLPKAKAQEWIALWKERHPKV